MTDTNEKSRQLGSAEDLRVEHLLDELRCTSAALAVSLKSLQKSPGNAVFRACADQQAQECRTGLGELLRADHVVYADEVAGEVLPELDPVLALCAKAEPEAGAPKLAAVFQAVADRVFDADRVRQGGRPCEAMTAFLSARATLPELPVEPEAPAPAPAPTPAQPEVLYETTFVHGKGAAKDHLGRAFLALLIHQRGLSQEEAQKHVHAQALIGFDRSIEQVLAGYSGPVVFRLVRYADGVRSELRRMKASTTPGGNGARSAEQGPPGSSPPPKARAPAPLRAIAASAQAAAL